uniref:Uncharacterized protein n=1 Tax=Solanum tuberosum TaxID=4113 RepID=M1DR11_SOLTU
MAITMVIPDASVMERETEIEGRSTIIGPQFEFFMGGNVVEYWRTVYLVHNNVRHVCVILQATEVSFAAESFLSLRNVDYSRFLTRYNGLCWRTESVTQDFTWLPCR